VALKWPNDLCLTDGPGRGRKLGGILIETLAVGESRMCVVGVGLNVLPQPAGSARDMAKDLASGYACLQEIVTGASAPAALAQVALPLVLAMQRFQAEGFAPLVAAYARRDMLLGHAVSVQTPDALQGVAEGVDEHGALLVRSGSMHRVISGEVSVRLAGIE
jgi:BirA family biotin operon repressor/biotin-[acetyl-CoA-carboxylase] ligase